MEVVRATGPGPNPGSGGPFQRHNIQEWQRLDQLTGVLETARRESGCWTNNQQQYGKVVDSCSLISGDGNAAQRQLRQLEVFQSRGPKGASLQVIRAQSHTSTSSNRWKNHSQNSTTDSRTEATDFQNLQLPLNPLDLSSQKTKASVGRSGSIQGRRPPTRPRSLTSTDLSKFHEKPSILERQNGDGKEYNNSSEIPEDFKTKFEDFGTEKRLNTALKNTTVDLKALDQILKSISSTKIEEKIEKEALKVKKRESFITAESLQEVRGRLRKLNSPKNEEDDGIVTEDSSIIKKEEISSTSRVKSYVYGTGRLRKLGSPKIEDNDDGIVTEDSSIMKKEDISPAQSRVKSYVYGTGRLRKLDTPKNEEYDDGIVTEDSSIMKKEDISSAQSKVKSYIYGMELKKPIIGTGSLESRTKIGRTEDWYNRRKSYGFEQVHNEEQNNGVLRKNKIESSTDSGICRSTEIVVVPTIKLGNNTTIVNLSDNNELFNVWNKRAIIKEENSNKEQITITIPIKSEENSQVYHPKELKRHSIAVDESKYTDNKFYQPRRNSLAVEECNEEDFGKKTKKVEFCKTEVHFAAESGRVNIVETDEKPPPTQNFRRRRRNSLTPEDFNKTDLPVTHFGDTNYEKKLFGVPDEINVTVSSISVNTNIANNEENIPRGILKNKLTKPKPYLLGDYQLLSEENTIWGVKLRPVNIEEPPQIWRSSVALQNEAPKPEFQKMLTILRPTKEEISWSVAERVKQVEKGYSTKINFGSGETTIVENASKNEDWSRIEEPPKKDISSSIQKKSADLLTSHFDKNRSSSIRCTEPLNKSNNSPKLEKRISSSGFLSSPSLVGNSAQKTRAKTESAFNMVNRVVNIKKPNLTKPIVEKSSPIWREKLENREYANLKTVIPTQEPIYENIDEVITNLQAMEKESNMLQELTKAADQILQAVNGYSDSDSSENDLKKHRLNLKKTPESLDTISETKSWRKQSLTNSISLTTKSKVKKTSSTSSVESVSKDSKPVPPVRMNRAAKLSEAKKKVTSSNLEKARRLQRANSREALLQSHGSSSEDVNNEIIRKPRLVRKCKMAEESGKKVAVAKRSQSEVKRGSERIPVQEIRHKTAVSTIKSTAEKNANKALKKEELKKKPIAKFSSKGLSNTRSRDVIGSNSLRTSSATSNSGSLSSKKLSKNETTSKYINQT